MISIEEIRKLKKIHKELEEKADVIEKKYHEIFVVFSDALEKHIENIEEVMNKDKNMKNPAAATKMKLAKRGMKLFKDVEYFQGWIDQEFRKENIDKETGLKFIAVTLLLKDGDIKGAREKFNEIKNTTTIIQNYKKSKEELEKIEKIIKRDQAKAKKILEEIKEIEKETVDEEKIRVYLEHLHNLEKMKNARKENLKNIISKPVIDILKEVEETHAEKYPNLFPRERIIEIKEFISQNPKLTTYKISQFHELFNLSEKKLAHICPEVTMFKKIILENKKLFETINNLEQTEFLEIRLEFEDDGHIEEYEKKKKIEERKKELQTYSENGLKKEIMESEELLKEIYTDDEIKQKKEEGLLSQIASFFK